MGSLLGSYGQQRVLKGFFAQAVTAGTGINGLNKEAFFLFSSLINIYLPPIDKGINLSAYVNTASASAI